MDSITYYRAMEAFSRQHAKMDGECEIFWLAEAEMLSKLGANAQKLNRLLHATAAVCREPSAVAMAANCSLAMTRSGDKRR
jgi:hypothetical protein